MNAWSPSRRVAAGWVALLAGALLVPRTASSASLLHCPKPLATVVVVEPDMDWWTEETLGSPRGLLEVLVDESGCFTRVDGKLDSTAKPDYALTPDLVGSAASGVHPTGGGVASDGVGAGGDGPGGHAPGGNDPGGSAAGVNPNGDGFSSHPVPRPDVNEVLLTLADLRQGKPDLITRGSARTAGAVDGTRSIPGLLAWSRSKKAMLVANAYLDAYRDLVNTLERRIKKETPR